MNTEAAKKIANQAYLNWYKHPAPDDWWDSLDKGTQEYYYFSAFWEEHPELSVSEAHELFKVSAEQ